MRRTVLAAMCWLALCGMGAAQTAAATGQSTVLGQQIAGLLADPAVSQAHWGVMVTELDGTPIYGLNEGQLFQPASNAKLYTTAAAMALLGPDRRFETKVIGSLDSATGRVTGDLVLKGGGDGNFDSGDLPYVAPANRPKNVSHQPHALLDIAGLVDQLVAKGVKQIDGDIVGDDTLFPWEPFGASWSIDDAVWGYGAPVSALTIADNQLRLTMAAGATAGQPGTVVLEQALPYYTIKGDVRTVATKAEATGMQVERMPGSRVLRIYGSMAVGDEADVEQVAIDDPAEYAAMALRATLVERGIAVKGVARTRHNVVSDASGFLAGLRTTNADEIAYLSGSPNDVACSTTAPNRSDVVLAKHLSAPLGEDVLFTNKVSQNLHAELLLHQLGHIDVLCGDGSVLRGARMIREFLSLRAGIDKEDFVFYDGSGLSSHDLVTPRATAKLLQFATTQSWFKGWIVSLPAGGTDGSLERRFAKPPLKDHVFAKTGTLGEARALSGYLDTASGKTVIFSIMVGNHLPGTTADRDAMDKIVAAIAAAE
jgi:serine-type D-Ala-D-Ala carboxypeptidase/endopeptidase (penicillin-binding protein 4)